MKNYAVEVTSYTGKSIGYCYIVKAQSEIQAEIMIVMMNNEFNCQYVAQECNMVFAEKIKKVNFINA